MQILELKTKLDEIEAQKAAIEAQMDAVRVGAAQEIANDVVFKCEAAGVSPKDVARILVPPATFKPKFKYTNPENSEQFYFGRGFPGWVRKGIAAAGRDPNSPADRIWYRDEVLIKTPLEAA